MSWARRLLGGPPPRSLRSSRRLFCCWSSNGDGVLSENPNGLLPQLLLLRSHGCPFGSSASSIKLAGLWKIKHPTSVGFGLTKSMIEDIGRGRVSENAPSRPLVTRGSPPPRGVPSQQLSKSHVVGSYWATERERLRPESRASDEGHHDRLLGNLGGARL